MIREARRTTGAMARGQRRRLVATLIALGTAAVGGAWADEAPPTGALATRAVLTGDWHGHRSDWAQRGIAIGIDHFGDFMVVADGGSNRGAYYSGLVEVGIELDLAALIAWPETRAVALGIGTFGRDPADGAGSIHAPSNLANVATGTLLAAWIERDFLDGRVALLGGLYAVDSEFDVKETTGAFMNGGFGTGLELSETGLNGPCVYPATCIGLRARYQADATHYAQLAILDGGAGDPDQPHGIQVHLGGGDGLFMIGEAGFQQDASQGRFVRAALGAWRYTTEFETLSQPAAPAPARTRNGTHGIYALLEGSLYSEPGRSVQGLSGFLRIGFADERINPIGRYAGAGLVYTGLLPTRDEDVLGLGVSAGFISADCSDARAMAGSPVESRELVVELTYWLRVLPWLSMQLNAQYISKPSADPGLDDAMLFGLRYQVTL